MDRFKDPDFVVRYTLEQAVDDGLLVELLKHRWPALTGGRPLVATAHLFREVSLAGLMEMWNEFVQWKKTVEPTLPKDDRLFTTRMNGHTVWVIDDGTAFTLMYPEDY
jgi:hypothetical protein